MTKEEVYLGEVYREAVSMTKAEIEAGNLADADAVIDFMDRVYEKLKDMRGKSVPFDEFEKYGF